MKKQLLSILLLHSLFTSAQKQVPYASGGASASYTGDISVGVEAGLWGVTSPLSVGVTYNTTPKTGDQFIGIKPYFTIADKPRWSAMVYTNPQFALNRNLFVIEEGIGLNYNLSSKVLLGYYFGVQHSRDAAASPLLSGCLVYLFRKKATSATPPVAQ